MLNRLNPGGRLMLLLNRNEEKFGAGGYFDRETNANTSISHSTVDP